LCEGAEGGARRVGAAKFPRIVKIESGRGALRNRVSEERWNDALECVGPPSSRDAQPSRRGACFYAEFSDGANYPRRCRHLCRLRRRHSVNNSKLVNQSGFFCKASARPRRSAFKLPGRARRMTDGDAAPARPAGHDPNEPSVGSAVAAQPPGSEREAVSRGYAEAEEPAGAASGTHVYKRGVPPERGGFISIQAVEELQSVAWRYGQNPCAHWRGNSSW